MEKLIIIGSGPAAHTAAIYAGRAKLKPLLFDMSSIKYWSVGNTVADCWKIGKQMKK